MKIHALSVHRHVKNFVSASSRVFHPKTIEYIYLFSQNKIERFRASLLTFLATELHFLFRNFDNLIITHVNSLF